jgi:hypothetical protein
MMMLGQDEDIEETSLPDARKNVLTATLIRRHEATTNRNNITKTLS